MTVAVLGTGSMGRTHLAAWRSLGVPAFAVGRDDDLAAALDGCSVVDVCTPTPSHLPLTLQAVAAGRHVICEKPLALTTADAERMVAACSAAGVRLLPAHVVRWFPDYAAAKRLIDEGRLGALRTLQLSRHVPVPRWSEWFADAEQSGGVVTDLMIHDLDAARWFAGEVVDLTAERTADDPAVGEAVTVRMVHASGTVSTVQGRWGASGVPLASPFTVAGTEGTFTGGATTGDVDPYAAQLLELYRGVTEGEPTRVSAADGVSAVRLAERARQVLRPTGA